MDKKNDDSYGVVCMTKKEGLEIGTNDVIFLKESMMKYENDVLGVKV